MAGPAGVQSTPLRPWRGLPWGDGAPPGVVALGHMRIEAIERPKAEERARKRTDLMQPDCQETFLAEAGQTRDAVARAVGGMSGRTYEKAKVVVAAAEAEYLSCKAALDARQAELDAGGGACESTLAT